MAINAFTLDWGKIPFYAFPPFSIIPRVLQNIFHDKATCILVVPDWPYQPWFSQCIQISNSKHFLSKERSSHSATEHGSPPAQKVPCASDSVDFCQVMDQPHYQSSTVKKSLLASWAPNTQASYSTYINKWMKYYQEHNLNPHQADYKEGMCFLAQLFEQNHKHGVIAVARSALSTVLYKRNGLSFGQDPNVSQMMKGIFKLHPTLPK